MHGFDTNIMEPMTRKCDSDTDEGRSKTIMAKGQGSSVIAASKIPSTFVSGSIKTKMYNEYASSDTPKSQNLSKTRQITPSSYDTQKWFPSIEGKSEGKISAKELQTAFKQFQGKHFSDNVCKFVVRLFDLDKNGGIDIREFEQLYSSVKKWVSAFNTCDRSRCGFLAESELDLALKQMEINFSPDFVTFLINRCDPVNKKMSLDQFIVTCVQMQKYTEEFRARDEKSDGIIKLKYEDFLELLMKTV
ncbi:sorcin-like [Onthophagus taurus]|uniref:sorcin-like n=1 Tax=Onthophagus taurus TaxID=166361 RepID=UPI000C1FFA80|nr:peflin-like [Onthophagus taurus]XP_022913214.1 peflin-like [Onthophagus taurus]